MNFDNIRTSFPGRGRRPMLTSRPRNYGPDETWTWTRRQPGVPAHLITNENLGEIYSWLNRLRRRNDAALFWEQQFTPEWNFFHRTNTEDEYFQRFHNAVTRPHSMSASDRAHLYYDGTILLNMCTSNYLEQMSPEAGPIARIVTVYDTTSDDKENVEPVTADINPNIQMEDL